MVFIHLPFRERKVLSEVSKLYCDMAINGEGYDDRIRQFWRISMYVKAGFLSLEDLNTICTASETFYEIYLQNPQGKDPDGQFRDLGAIIPKLRILADQKNRTSEKRKDLA